MAAGPGRQWEERYGLGTHGHPEGDRAQVIMVVLTGLAIQLRGHLPANLGQSTAG
jgi:hypothetical protein